MPFIWAGGITVLPNSSGKYILFPNFERTFAISKQWPQSAISSSGFSEMTNFEIYYFLLQSWNRT
jgi:hypothetical protein